MGHEMFEGAASLNMDEDAAAPRTSWPTWPIFAFIAAFWSFLLFGSGVIFSGGHFLDDHEIAEISNALKHQSFGNTMRSYVIGDLGDRFRPMFWVQRVTQAGVFGAHYALWQLYGAVLAIATTMLLYLFARRIGLAIAESLALPFLALVGQQAVIWWRTGVQETLGMFLLSAALLALANSVFGKRRALWSTAFVLLAVLMSLAKESFSIFTPALVFLAVWLEREARDSSWLDAIRANVAIGSALLVVLAVEIARIKLTINTAIGYDAHFGFDLVDWLRVIAFLGLIYAAIFVGIALIGAVGLKGSTRQERRELAPKLWPPLLFAGIAVVRQTLLYARSGIHERYLNPTTTALALLLVYAAALLGAGRPRVRRLLLLLMLVAVAITSVYSFHIAQLYAIDGETFNGALHYVEAETQPSSPILVAADPASDLEFAVAVKEFLAFDGGRGNEYVYLLKTPSGPDPGYGEQTLQFYGHRVIGSLKGSPVPDAVILTRRTEPEFVREMGRLDAYRRVAFDAYVAYVRRK